MRILRISTAIPENGYSTDELINDFPCSLPQGVRQSVLNLGVLTRYFIQPVDLSPSLREAELSEGELIDLCVNACRDALEKSGLSIKDIGYFILTHDASPILCPGLSHLIIRGLGFSPSVKHVNVQGMACTAFNKSLELAEDHLARFPDDSVLICISGVNSYWFHSQIRGIESVMEIDKIVSLKDGERREYELRKWIATMEFFLFGDGVASVIVSRDGDGPVVRKIVSITNLKADDYLAGYARISALNEPFKIGLRSHLDKSIPKLGLRYISEALNKAFEGRAREVIDGSKKVAIHTGSRKVLNQIAEHHNIKYEKIEESYRVLANYGNLSGASVPFILEMIMSNTRIHENEYVLALGFGWGFSSGICLLTF